MKEIDNRGSEFFPLHEELKGAKHYGLGFSSPLLAPLLSVAAAGLIALAVLSDLPPDTPPEPPYRIEDREPDEPPEDPKKPEEPDRDPKKPEEPVSPPPTTPPPTTPPPTTPPPTTPPPTTPPPTTPPPTTPPPSPVPPYVPIDEPEEPEPVVPSFRQPTLSFSTGYTLNLDSTVSLYLNYELDPGSATAVQVSPVSVTQFGSALPVSYDGTTPPWAEIGSGWKNHVLYMPAGSVDPPEPITVTLSISYQHNGSWVSMPDQTISVPFVDF